MCLSIGIDLVGNLWKKNGENHKFWVFSWAGFFSVMASVSILAIT